MTLWLPRELIGCHGKQSAHFIAGGTPAKSQGNKFTKGTGVVGEAVCKYFCILNWPSFAKKI